MINNGKIILLDNVIVDHDLPKHKIINAYGFMGSPTNIVWSGSSSDPSTDRNIRRTLTRQMMQSLEYEYSITKSPLLKLKIWFYKAFYSISKEKKMNPEHLPSFFGGLKKSVDNLKTDDIQTILDKYNTVLDNARLNNQVALVEKITEYASTLKNEITLSASSFNKYLTEQNVVDFYNVASRHEKFNTGLMLTYIKNFTKIIPDDITKLKVEADKLLVFDNYVILHYDPSGKAVEKTNAEKDPILFGVIKNSRNLYYIGDWIDEYCDLTLDVIINKIGKKPQTLTTDSVIENINKI